VFLAAFSALAHAGVSIARAKRRSRSRDARELKFRAVVYITTGSIDPGPPLVGCNLNYQGEHHANKMACDDGPCRSDPDLRPPSQRDDQRHACWSDEIG
jgi:hypothetical protein